MSDTPRTSWILVAAIFVVGLFAAAQFGKLSLTLTPMQMAYPEVKAWVPSLVSIVGIVGLIFGVIAGPFVARFGLSQILLASLLVGACMSFLQALLPPFEVFVLTRIIEGFSHLGLVISAPTLIAMVCTDTDRPLAMGIWASFFGASLAIMAFFMPQILTNGGLPMLFALHGGGMLVVFAVLIRSLPATPPEAVVSVGIVQAYRRIYTTPNLLIPGVGFVWYTGIYIALIAVLPIALDLSPRVTAIIPLISIAGSLGAGVAARYVAPHHLSNAGFVASAVLMVALWRGWDGHGMIYLFFFLMGAIPTGAFAAIAHFNPTTASRAQATGGLTHFGNIGTTLGTPLMVLAYQGAGLAGIMVMVVICCAGGLISIAGVLRKIA